jgi:redox-sensitive bicupin YhaK (pirin superfamily)
MISAAKNYLMKKNLLPSALFFVRSDCRHLPYSDGTFDLYVSSYLFDLLNDDEIQAGTGFPLHGHADMEIITYVRRGAITHQDSLGNKGRTAAGDVQVMSAGTGIRHSEYNLEPETTTLFQIWIIPTARGRKPRWDTRPFPKADRSGRFVPLASGFAEDEGALPIGAAARVVGVTLKAGEGAEYRLAPGRRAYLVSARGAIEVNGTRLGARDGAAIANERSLFVTAVDDAEIVLVDVS